MRGSARGSVVPLSARLFWLLCFVSDVREKKTSKNLSIDHRHHVLSLAALWMTLVSALAGLYPSCLSEHAKEKVQRIEPGIYHRARLKAKRLES